MSHDDLEQKRRLKTREIIGKRNSHFKSNPSHASQADKIVSEQTRIHLDSTFFNVLIEKPRVNSVKIAGKSNWQTVSRWNILNSLNSVQVDGVPGPVNRIIIVCDKIKIAEIERRARGLFNGSAVPSCFSVRACER